MAPVKLNISIDIAPNELDRVPAILGQWNRQNWFPEPVRNQFLEQNSIVGTLSGTLVEPPQFHARTTVEPQFRPEPIPVPVVPLLVPRAEPAEPVSGTNGLRRQNLPQWTKALGVVGAIALGSVGLTFSKSSPPFSVALPVAVPSLTLAHPQVEPSPASSAPKLAPQKAENSGSLLDDLLPIQRR